ncbi:hypothetical protein D3C83_114350 [compost metagenome]
METSRISFNTVAPATILLSPGSRRMGVPPSSQRSTMRRICSLLADGTAMTIMSGR